MATRREPTEDLVSATGSVSRLAFSPDGTLLAAAREYAVEVRDGITGEPLRVLAGHTGDVQGVAFAPDGRRLVPTSFDHTVAIWAPVAGRAARILANQGSVYALEFSPHGGLLAVAPDDGAPRIHDAATGAVRHVLTGHLNGVHALAFAPTGPPW